MVWLSDGRRLLALAIVFATLVGAWMFRYQPVGNGGMHVNRFTGVACSSLEECWFGDPQAEALARFFDAEQRREAARK